MFMNLLFAIITVGFVPFGSVATQEPSKMKHTPTCQYWQSKVDKTVRGPEGVRGDPRAEGTEMIIKGIDCLLMMEGNKNPARFSGAVSDQVSDLIPQATVDVAALYYISYLYYQKWEFADAIALRSPGGAVNTPHGIKEAYQSYRKWFKRVKKIGLAKARDMKIEPLKNTRVHWY